MDINIKCESCATELIVDQSLAGQNAPCPNCGKLILIAGVATPKKLGLGRPPGAAAKPLATLANVPPQVPPAKPDRALTVQARIYDILLIIVIASYVAMLLVGFAMLVINHEDDVLRYTLKSTMSTLTAALCLWTATTVLKALAKIEFNTRRS